MKKSRLRGAACACLATISINVNAALIERLGGLAYYDTDDDLTWLADASYAQTSGYDADGLMSLTQSNSWVAGLDVAGVTGWRLPNTLEPDPSCDPRSGNDHFINCTGSEMGNLYYNVLGNTPGRLNGFLDPNTGPFSNVEYGWYWSATVCGQCTGMQWIFNMWSGDQIYFGIDSGALSAWAVQSGDVGAVPIPAAVWLFGSGLLGLVGVAKKKTV